MIDRSNGWTKTQLSLFFVIILLAVDEFNPVKMLLHTFPSLQPWQIAVICVALMIYIFVSDLKHHIFHGLTVFFQSILSIFFHKVHIIGRHHIPPPHEPVLFAINHANQFMDAVMVLCTCQRPQISYLMAEASWKRRIIGDLAWALDVVPVKRAQDSATAGTGQIQICFQQSLVRGNDDTLFAQELAVGDKIRLPQTAAGLKITQIDSDQQLHVSWDDLPPAVLSELETALHNNINDAFLPFDILKRTPLDVVFAKVLDKLALQGAVGIFPEGGSHDRTDLLPLKIGISLIAYSALDKHGLRIPVVPVGLSYFGAHRWRGRAVVEYGKPVYVNLDTLAAFQAGGPARRAVCQDLLTEIEAAMRSVIVSSQDYETLELLHTARRLWTHQGPVASIGGGGSSDSSSSSSLVEEKQDLARRFTLGYQRLLREMKGQPPQEWLDLQERLRRYRNELKDLGLKDYQVQSLAAEHWLDEPDARSTTSSSVASWSTAGVVGDDLPEHDSVVDGDTLLRYLKVPYQIVHLLALLIIAAVPTLLLNLPVGIMAGLYAEQRRKKALAKSKVKIKGIDVMLTEKVVFCIVMVPTLWFIYFCILYFGTNLDGPAIALIIMSMPVFSYVGIVVAEAGMIDWKEDVRPRLLRLLPTTRRRLQALPRTRRQLQTDLRAFIRKMGPQLGDLYFAKELDWAALWKPESASSKKDA